MPYIAEHFRNQVDAGKKPENAGELTYKLYKECVGYVGMNSRFQDYGEVILALECAKQEFYRRYVAPYEDEKIDQNGDVCRG